MGSKTNPIPMVYMDAGLDLPIGAKEGDIFIQTGSTAPIVKIDSDGTSWVPLSPSSWSSTSITIDADDFKPTVFGKTLSEIKEIIENEEKLRKKMNT